MPRLPVERHPADPDIERMDKASKSVVVPLGSVEQHGEKFV